MSKAFIQKPAPAFSAKAIDKSGEFVDIKLSDYKGTLLNINGNYFPLFDFALISISHLSCLLQENIWSSSFIR